MPAKTCVFASGRLQWRICVRALNSNAQWLTASSNRPTIARPLGDDSRLSARTDTETGSPESLLLILGEPQKSSATTKSPMLVEDQFLPGSARSVIVTGTVPVELELRVIGQHTAIRIRNGSLDNPTQFKCSKQSKSGYR